MQGLDRVLNAADPLNIAQRRMAMMQAQYQSQLLPLQLEYQKELLPAQIKYMQEYGMPFPKSPQEAIAARTYINNNHQAELFRNARGDTSTGSTNPYSNKASTWDPTTGTTTSRQGNVETTTGPIEEVDYPNSGNASAQPEPQATPLPAPTSSPPNQAALAGITPQEDEEEV